MSIQAHPPAFATFPPRRSSADARSDAPARVAPTVAILRTLDAIEVIAAEWRALEWQTPEATGFQSLDWCRAWMRACGGDAQWQVLTVRDGGRLVAVWPLQRDRLLGARVLTWLGEPWTQYGDVLVAPGAGRIAYLAAGWREIAAWTDVDIVKLGRVRSDAALMALPGWHGRTALHREAAPCVDLRRPAPRSPDKRLRARARKLEALGPITVNVVTDPRERRICAAQAIALKREWLAARGLASSGLWHGALEGLMAEMAGSERLVIGRLCVGSDIAALELGLRTPGGFRSLLGCHDPRFATGSPGHLLIGHMIDWCRGQGLATYDLMVPDDAYKRRWADSETIVVDHIVQMRWRGRFAAACYRARPALKTIYARLPSTIRGSLAAATRR